MKKIIKGAVYDTETAKVIGAYDSGYPLSDFHAFTETLYRTKAGNYFVYGEGGGLSPYGEWHGNSGGPGERITPMTYADAKSWAETKLTGDEYIQAFGDPEDGSTRISITLSAAAKNRLDLLRVQTGETFSEIVERLIIAESGKRIDLVYRADGQKGAEDGGTIRKACKADCSEIVYSELGSSASIVGLSKTGKAFIEACPDDCLVEIIGGDPAHYQAAVVAW